jgi:hypothetical protein
MRALPPGEALNLSQVFFRHEAVVAASTGRFGLAPSLDLVGGISLQPRAAGTAAFATVYRRKPEPKGPMNGFGYSWLDDHLKQAGLARPALLSREASEDGPSFGYETLNLVDGRRSVQAIRDELAVTVAPAPVEEVADYLATLERVGLLERKGS